MTLCLHYICILYHVPYYTGVYSYWVYTAYVQHHLCVRRVLEGYYDFKA